MQTIMSGVCVSAAAVCVLPPPKPVGAAVSFCCVEFCPPCMVLSMQAWVCPPWRCLKRYRRSDSLQGSSRLRRTQSRLHLSARPHRISPEEFPRSVPCPAALHPVFPAVYRRSEHRREARGARRHRVFPEASRRYRPCRPCRCRRGRNRVGARYDLLQLVAVFHGVSLPYIRQERRARCLPVCLPLTPYRWNCPDDNRPT